jgi:hypothetical protein
MKPANRNMIVHYCYYPFFVDCDMDSEMEDIFNKLLENMIRIGDYYYKLDINVDHDFACHIVTEYFMRPPFLNELSKKSHIVFFDYSHIWKSLPFYTKNKLFLTFHDSVRDIHLWLLLAQYNGIGVKCHYTCIDGIKIYRIKQPPRDVDNYLYDFMVDMVSSDPFVKFTRGTDPNIKQPTLMFYFLTSDQTIEISKKSTTWTKFKFQI